MDAIAIVLGCCCLCFTVLGALALREIGAWRKTFDLFLSRGDVEACEWTDEPAEGQ